MPAKAKFIHYLIISLFYFFCIGVSTVAASQEIKNAQSKGLANMDFSSLSGQKMANKIAAITSSTAAHLDSRQLLEILTPILDENHSIKALSIFNTATNNSLFSFYRVGDKKVYNRVIPKRVLALEQFTAAVIFDNNQTAELTIYYYYPLHNAKKSVVHLTAREQKWIESNTPIHYVYNPDWVPFERTNDMGRYSGIISEIIRLIKVNSGLNLVEIQSGSWEESSRLMQNRAADMFSAVSITQEQKAYVNFSKIPLISTPYVFVSRKSEDFADGFEHFIPPDSNHKLAIVAGYASHSIMIKQHPEIPLVLLNTAEEGFKKLLSKDIDVFLVDKVSAKYFINQAAYKELIIGYKTNFKLKLHVAIRNDWPPEVLSIIDKTIIRFNESELNNIYDKWTGNAKKVTVLDYETLNEEISNLSFIELLTAEEMFFACFITLLSAYFIFQNYSKSKFLNISFNHFILFIVGFEIIMVTFILYELVVLDRIENLIAGVYRDKHEMITLVEQFRQDYDNLSLYARSYAASNKLEYKKSYDAILAIKKGLKPRPQNYYGTYWHLDDELKKQRHPDAEKISLMQMMAALPYSKEEFKWLRQSKSNSTVLTNLEAKAFRAVKNNKSSLALQQLYSPAYFQASAVLMHSVDNVFNSIKYRSDASISLLGQNIANAYKTIAIASVVFILANLIIYLMMVKKIREPLAYLSDTLQRFKSGSGNIEEKKFYDDEIGVMNREFFSMRKAIQEQMNAQIEAEEKTRLLLTSVGEGIFGVGSDGLVNFINPAALEMLQYTENEILGQDIHALIHHSYANGMSYPIEKCPMFHALKEGVIGHVENELLWRKDGSSFPVEYKARPILKNNQLSGAVVAFNNITERLQAKDQLISEIAERKQSELMAEQAKLHLENITNSIPGVVYQFQLLNNKIKVNFVSYGIKQLHGIEPEQLVDDFSLFIDSICVDDQEHFLNMLNHSVKTLEYFNCEYRLLDSEGEIKWIHMEASVTEVFNQQNTDEVSEDESSKKIILNGNLVDVTEAKNAHNLVVKQQLEIQKIHKQTQDSIEYAALIQGALVPDRKLFQAFFQDSFVIWQPKDIIGGDIYLMEQINQNEVLLMVIDCTGHGVPGAFVSMLVKAIERQLTGKLNRFRRISPAKLLAVFNRSIKDLLQQEEKSSSSNAGFDGGILYYNKKHRFIRFSGANTPLFIVQNDELKIIKGDRHSIGYRQSDASYVFNDHQIDVRMPTQIYLTTDGYFDQNGGKKGFPFGKGRFSQIIMKHKQESLADQKEILLDELEAYQQDHERNDDITIIALKL